MGLLFDPLLLWSALTFGHHQEGPRDWVSGVLSLYLLRGRVMLSDRVTRWLDFLWMSPSFLAPNIPNFNPSTIELLEGTAQPRKLDSVLHPPLKGRHTSVYQVSDLHPLQPPCHLHCRGRETGRSEMPLAQN